MELKDDDRRQKVYAARDVYVKSLGSVDPDVLTPVINPGFMDGPLWPDTRQAWCVIRRESSLIIMSDGLSDPFCDDPEPNPGFGLEVLVETSDPLPDQLQGTWLMDLVYGVSQQCAFHGGVRQLIDRLSLVSLELPITAALEPVATPNRKAGVLLGPLPPSYPAGFEVPGGDVQIVVAKLLWPSELAYVASGGNAAREDLAKRFVKNGSFHRSSLLRKPVV